MRIIPAIDIIDGKCVRLTKGDYQTKKVYHEDPLEVAMQFADHGIEYLHLVDLDGAKSSKIVNYKVLERLAQKTNLNIDFGGGLKSDEDVRIAFEAGAQQITAGSIVIKNEAIFLKWLEQYGSDKIILGADANHGKIAISGWVESSERDVQEFIATYISKGVKYVISTDIQKDGMLQGPSVDLYQEILTDNPDLNLIASGGIANIDDVFKVKEVGCEGVIIGKAIYENRITLKDLEQFILKN